jgi:hypothetical protein
MALVAWAVSAVPIIEISPDQGRDFRGRGAEKRHSIGSRFSRGKQFLTNDCLVARGLVSVPGNDDNRGHGHAVA